MRNYRSLCHHQVRLENGCLVSLKHQGLCLPDHHLPGQRLDAVRAAAVEFSVTVWTSHLIPTLTVLCLVTGNNSTEKKGFKEIRVFINIKNTIF